MNNLHLLLLLWLTLLPRHVNPRIGGGHGHATVTEALCAKIKEEKATNVRFSYEKQNN